MEYAIEHTHEIRGVTRLLSKKNTVWKRKVLLLPHYLLG